MKAAICQKHCEKLWGIHWKQMGFFSFNSEILSLSGTIKTNGGATQNVIKQELARLSLCPWAFPRGPAWGRDGAVRDWSGTSPAPPAPPLGYQQVLQTGGRGAGESSESEPPLEHPRGVQGTRFLVGREGLRGIPGSADLPTRSCPPELGQGLPHLQVSTDTHLSLHRARDKDS